MFTKEQICWWQAYELVRQSGITNMLDTELGCKFSGLTREQYLFVIKNYTALRVQAEPQ